MCLLISLSSFPIQLRTLVYGHLLFILQKKVISSIWESILWSKSLYQQFVVQLLLELLFKMIRLKGLSWMLSAQAELIVIEDGIFP
jgi:hypothetical protein